MVMRKQRRLSWIVGAALSLLTGGCSEVSYHAAMDGESGKAVESSRRWEVRLPYESGEEMSIKSVSGNEVLLSEARDDFYLVRIPLDNVGKPGSPKHLKIEHGESCE